MSTKDSNKHAALPKFEISLYFSFWFATILYSLCRVYTDGNRFLSDKHVEEDFMPGWSILGRKIDVSDYEWTVWVSHLLNCIPWLVLHVILTATTKYFCLEAIPLCHAIITCSFVLYHYQVSILAFYICLLFIYYGAMQLNSRFLIWMISVLLLLTINSLTIMTYESFQESSQYDSKVFMVSQSVSWFIMRCIEYSLVEHASDNGRLQKLMDMVAYTFYFPCFHWGPFIPYQEFQGAVYLPLRTWKYHRSICFIYDLGKYVGWIFIFQIASHYFYCNAMHFHIQMFSVDLWTLNGIGYCMGQFFHIKYFVFYGLMGSIAKFEQYEVPPPPRCINRVYMYSDMWRHFDRGYYLFIFRRIYRPVCGDSSATLLRKLWASFLCFSFVYIWHGVTYTVFYWSLFNFIGITLEAIGKAVGVMPSVKKWKVRNLSKVNMRRFHSVLCAPLWVLAVISNFIFFGGHDVGFMYFKQFLSGSWKLFAVISTFAYCTCQVSIEMSCWLKTREKGVIAKKDT